MSTFDHGDTGSAERWIDDRRTAVDDRSGCVADLAEQIYGLSVDAYTADGAVEVTVDSRGTVTGIRLDERVLHWTPDTIGDEILRAIRRGNEMMTGRVTEVVREVVGSGASASHC